MEGNLPHSTGPGRESKSTRTDEEPTAFERKPEGRVLIVDDDVDTCGLLSDGLQAHGYLVDSACEAEGALAKLEGNDFDVLLLDVKLGVTNGFDLCTRVVLHHPEVPVVMVTAYGSMDAAVEAIRAGAYDFVTKPVALRKLMFILERAIGFHRLKAEVHRLRTAVAAVKPFEEMVGESEAMRNLFNLLERLQDSHASVLITGESGTGKELVARAIHARSPYSSGRLVALNCAAVPAALLESTLFGHVRGAFTDAKESRTGLLLEADGGTLFLDEIGEMPLSMQTKLLRVLQERKVRPVGGNAELAFDTRIVAATNLDLGKAVRERRFREDLYYRINVIAVDVPPLRCRGNDILLLAQSFLEREAARSNRRVVGIAPEAARKLLTYSWPGNVRELENAIERAVALTRCDKITIDDLPATLTQTPFDVVAFATGNNLDAMPSLAELERGYIERVLSAAGGNKTRAAAVLEVDRRTLHRKLRAWKTAADEPSSPGTEPPD